MTHATKYPAPVLSLGISGDAGLLAVGLADGTLTVRKHARPKALAGDASALAAAGASGAATAAARRRARLEMNAGNFRYFLRGRSAKAAAGDYAVARRRSARLAPYDKLLKAFQYRWAGGVGLAGIGGGGGGVARPSPHWPAAVPRCQAYANRSPRKTPRIPRDALDAALATKQPGVVDALLEEVAARGGLHAALGGRDAARLLPLLRHLARCAGGRSIAGSHAVLMRRA